MRFVNLKENLMGKFKLSVTASLFSICIASSAWATQIIDTDLVIVGGGLSGISAAARTTELGVKPVVLEKTSILGGAGNFPEGSLGLGTKYQKEHSITWDIQKNIDRFLDFNHFRTNPAVIRQLIGRSGETIDWVTDKGVEIRGIRTLWPQGESYNCWHLFKGGASNVVAKLSDQVKKNGGTVLLQTPAQKLINRDGKIVGVEAVNTKTGEKVIVHAKKVILASGGFAANKGMIEKYVTDSSDLSVSEPIRLRSAIGDGRTGDGINMALRVGASVANMENVVGNAPYLPEEPLINQFNGADYLKHGRCALVQPWLWVNRDGERFYNESRGSLFTDVYAAMTNAGGVMYTIFDQNKLDRLMHDGALIPFNAIVPAGTKLTELPKTFEVGMKNGWAFKADTIDDLALQIGVPAENLKKTIAQINEFADQKKDPEYGRNPAHLEKFDLNKGPFYALKGIRTYFLTLGGIRINKNFEAQNAQGDSIPNLYVVGADMGGLFDSTDDLKVEGATSSFALTSGRIAAERAVESLK